MNSKQARTLFEDDKPQADPGLFPILMRRDDIVLMKRAVELTGKDERTLRKWDKQYRIARQSTKSAPKEFSAPALMMVLHGDAAALELLRCGQRTHPRVKRYFDHLGLPF